jgi:hypothetical protein
MAGLLAGKMFRQIAAGAINVSLFEGTCFNALDQRAAFWQSAGGNGAGRC